MSEKYLFEIREVLSSELRPQAAVLAEMIPEAIGRQKLPKLWNLTDKLRSLPKADRNTIKKRQKHRVVLGTIDLLLGLVFLGPALVEPGELLAVLIVCTVCLIAGIASLWNRHRILLAVPMILAGLFLHDYRSGRRREIPLPAVFRNRSVGDGGHRPASQKTNKKESQAGGKQII